MLLLYKPKSKNQTGGMIMRSIGVNYLKHRSLYGRPADFIRYSKMNLFT